MSMPENTLLFTDSETGIEVWMKRLDLAFDAAMGNKVYKLRYNIKTAVSEGFDTLLTFGGAFSNHIAAVARTGKKEGLHTIGIIRGGELGKDIKKTLDSNSTLRLARENGMKLDFVSRQTYRQKDTAGYNRELHQKYGSFYYLPEGGTNELAVSGCQEILSISDRMFDVVCCPVGTGGTMAGLIKASSNRQKIIGYTALNADLSSRVENFVKRDNWQLFPDHHFGGFAKINSDLVSFINRFKRNYNILLDPIYTGKMMYRLIKDIRNGAFTKNSRILAIHTGGLQGIDGMNVRLAKKGAPLIKKYYL